MTSDSQQSKHTPQKKIKKKNNKQKVGRVKGKSREKSVQEFKMFLSLLE